MSHVKIDNEFLLAVRRKWEVRRPKSNIYLACRLVRQHTQHQAADATGIGRQSWKYREKVKTSFQLGELIALKAYAGVNWSDFGKLLEACA